MNSKEEFSLEQLINFCCDARSPYNARAWTVLLERYQNYIYKIISKKCKFANIDQIDLNFSDTVNEIYHEVIIRLCKDDCKALREFKHKDKERVFLSWLARIANHTAFYFIMKNYIKQVQTSDIEVVQKYISSVSSEVNSQVYEDVVRLLNKPEKKSNRKKININARDINIFTMTMWQGFNLKMLQTIPCLQHITERIVANACYRSREKLFKNRDLLN